MELKKDSSKLVKEKSFEEKAQEASTLVDSIILIGAPELEICQIIENNPSLLEADL